MFFSVRPPQGPETPVVVEIPHAGLLVDPVSMSSMAAPVRSLGMDADLYVDELYADATDLGATLLVAHVSRYVCDLNRSEADVDPLAAQGGRAHNAPHGLIWRTTTDEQPALFSPLSSAEMERRLNDIYRPYHAALQQLLEHKHEKFGYAVLLCAHSMPSRGRVGHADPGRRRADVVPGSRGFTSAAESIIRAPERLAEARGWSLAHDDPYRGGFTTGHYGRPDSDIHALQVELSRSLYMDEAHLTKTPESFDKTREFCRELVAELCRLRPERRG